jgi:hypothetical protein
MEAYGHYFANRAWIHVFNLFVLQNAWGDRATAVMLVCQNCGATHVTKDGDGERRTISTMENTNKYDKAHNRYVPGCAL